MSAGNFYKARTGAACVFVALLAACGGGGGGDSGSGGTTTTTTSNPQVALAPASITLAWNANHESGVNSAGGGYELSISGQPTITLPYVSGAAAPTSTTLTLGSGSYTASVRAFAALDAQGGTTRTYSAPQVITFTVP